jgi:D-tyrosyl-tRNA(Tyr) deacylase
MRVLVQEVLSASVNIDGKLYSKIGRGFCLFVAFKEGDNIETIKKMAHKVLGLRIFPDETGKTNRSLNDVGGEILSVSQFTLYASVKEGNRPSFIGALKPQLAAPLYAYWNNVLMTSFPTVKTGVFGADMKVELINDGPFTLWIDSEDL